MVNTIPSSPEMPEASEILEINREKIQEYIQLNIPWFSVVQIYFSQEKEDSLCMLWTWKDGYMYLVTLWYDVESKTMSDLKHDTIG
jgi:hypothetical protein